MADTVHYCPYCNRHSCHVETNVGDKCELSQIAFYRADIAELRLALETATRERDEARRDLAASHREADRLRHGEAIESDYVCPESLRADKAEAERDAAVTLLREVAGSGVEFEDERISYTSVQIDRETWAAVRALAQKGAHDV